MEHLRLAWRKLADGFEGFERPILRVGDRVRATVGPGRTGIVTQVSKGDQGYLILWDALLPDGSEPPSYAAKEAWVRPLNLEKLAKTAGTPTPFSELTCGTSVTKDRGYFTPMNPRQWKEPCGRPAAVALLDDTGKVWGWSCSRPGHRKWLDDLAADPELGMRIEKVGTRKTAGQYGPPYIIISSTGTAHLVARTAESESTGRGPADYQSARTICGIHFTREPAMVGKEAWWDGGKPAILMPHGFGYLDDGDDFDTLVGFKGDNYRIKGVCGRCKAGA